MILIADEKFNLKTIIMLMFAHDIIDNKILYPF